MRVFGQVLAARLMFLQLFLQAAGRAFTAQADEQVGNRGRYYFSHIYFLCTMLHAQLLTSIFQNSSLTPLLVVLAIRFGRIGCRIGF